MTELIVGEDSNPRCWWGSGTPDYISYHDTEWGFGVTDDKRLFEKVCLEGFQAGLSWLTILRKRDNFRAAFSDFDPATVAAYGETDVARLLQDAGIVRHQGKIRSTINNANKALEMIEQEGSLARYFWRHADWADEPPVVLDSTTPTSVALSRDLKNRGWTFVGPTTISAFMQAMGLVNDHLAGCWVRPLAASARQAIHSSLD